MKVRGPCAYCGEKGETDDHVIPRTWYPDSVRANGPQFVTVSACERCNRSFQDDEIHVRAVLLHAGQPNAAVMELYQGPFGRSLRRPDAARRLGDVHSICRTVKAGADKETRIYPADDARVLRILKKICRGLAVHRKLASSVPEELVWVDLLRYQIPPELTVDWGGSAANVAQYAFVPGVDDIESFWLLKFFETRFFIGAIKKQIESPGAAGG